MGPVLVTIIHLEVVVRRITALLCLLALSLLISACGSSSSSSSSSSESSSPTTEEGSSPTTEEGQTSELPAVTMSTGEGSVEIPEGEPLKVAYFGFGRGFGYTNAQYEGAEQTAEKLGIEVKYFDPGAEPTKQVEEMDQVIASGEYNAAIISPVEGNAICDLATKKMPEAGIAVILTEQGICETGSEPEPAQASNGLVAFVGGQQNVRPAEEWAEQALKENPGPQEAIVLTGPATDTPSINAALAAEAVAKKNPNLKIAQVVRTNYTSPDAQQKMTSALQAHTDATMVLSMYGELTRGAVVALQQAGKTEQVKVYDIGASPIAFGYIKQGLVQMTYPIYPYSELQKSLELLNEVRNEGGEINAERYYGNDGHPPEPMAKGAPLLFITKANLAEAEQEGISEEK